MYEGSPDTPHWGGLEIIDAMVSRSCTAPTAIRALMNGQLPRQYDLSSLRLLGSVGEPINDPWRWYHDEVGGGRCPIVDTWWQARDGRHHDICHGCRSSAQAWSSEARMCHQVASRDRRPHHRRHRRRRSSEHEGSPSFYAALALDDARHLRRFGEV